MSISKLKIAHFRNIIDADLAFSEHFNVIFGENGAGKTSLLEALYYLGFNRSFRTSMISQIIQHHQHQFLLFVECSATGQGEEKRYKIGFEKSLEGNKTLRINSETARSFADAAKILPLQFISTDSHRLFHDGPKERRQAMDWGTFHVEHNFLFIWQKLQKALKQRNALLKNEENTGELRKLILPWNQELANAAEKIHAFRKNYVSAVHPLLQELVAYFLPEKAPALTMEYLPGWDTNEPLLEILDKNFFQDRQAGYTQHGPQRADLQFHYQGIPVEDHFSQGQQKLTAYAFQLAQGQLVKNFTGNTPIYLIDDLSSELDQRNRRLVLEVLTRLEAQCFITEITPSEDFSILPSGTKMFHMKHGTICVG